MSSSQSRRVIYHDRRRDTGSGLAALESSSPTISVGNSMLVLALNPTEAIGCGGGTPGR